MPYPNRELDSRARVTAGRVSLPDEHWLPVVGYEGLYDVSDHGRVWSYGRNAVRGSHLYRVGEGIVVPLLFEGRYWRVRLYRDEELTVRRVHQLVLEAFDGPCPEGQESCHGPKGGLDNHRTNLRWDTRSENLRDIGRHARLAHALPEPR